MTGSESHMVVCANIEAEMSSFIQTVVKANGQQ